MATTGQGKPVPAGSSTPFLLPAEGRAGSHEDSFSSCLPTGGGRGFEKGQSLPETQKQEVRAFGGVPLLLFCSGLGTVKGQSAQESESQQVAAIPTHNVKLTNKTGKMKNGGGKDKPKQSPAPICGMGLEPGAGSV